jgi:hypothetical protein
MILSKGLLTAKYNCYIIIEISYIIHISVIGKRYDNLLLSAIKKGNTKRNHPISARVVINKGMD